MEKLPPSFKKGICRPQAREKVWMGQNHEAIEICTQAMSEGGVELAGKIGFLAIRTECYIAQGKLDLAVADLVVMIKLAAVVKKPMLDAKAFNRQTMVQMRIGNLTDVVKKAISAIEIKYSSLDLSVGKNYTNTPKLVKRNPKLFKPRLLQWRCGRIEERFLWNYPVCMWL